MLFALVEYMIFLGPVLLVPFLFVVMGISVCVSFAKYLGEYLYYRRRNK